MSVERGWVPGNRSPHCLPALGSGKPWRFATARRVGSLICHSLFRAFVFKRVTPRVPEKAKGKP